MLVEEKVTMILTFDKHAVMSSVIYYSTDAWENAIYIFVFIITNSYSLLKILQDFWAWVKQKQVFNSKQ